MCYKKLLQAALVGSLVSGCAGPGGADTAPSETNKQAIKLLLLDADGESQRYALYSTGGSSRACYAYSRVRPRWI